MCSEGEILTSKKYSFNANEGASPRWRIVQTNVSLLQGIPLVFDRLKQPHISLI
jgi:hypothetical protein